MHLILCVIAAFACSNFRIQMPMDPVMLCCGMVILVGLLALMGIGVLLFVSGVFVEPAPYPLQIAMYALASCAICTLAVELCIWERYNEDNLVNNIVNGHPLGRQSIMIDSTHAGPVVMGVPIGIVDVN